MPTHATGSGTHYGTLGLISWAPVERDDGADLTLALASDGLILAELSRRDGLEILEWPAGVAASDITVADLETVGSAVAGIDPRELMPRGRCRLEATAIRRDADGEHEVIPYRDLAHALTTPFDRQMELVRRPLAAVDDRDPLRTALVVSVMRGDDELIRFGFVSAGELCGGSQSFSTHTNAIWSWVGHAWTTTTARTAFARYHGVPGVARGIFPVDALCTVLRNSAQLFGGPRPARTDGVS